MPKITIEARVKDWDDEDEESGTKTCKAFALALGSLLGQVPEYGIRDGYVIATYNNLTEAQRHNATLVVEETLWNIN